MSRLIARQCAAAVVLLAIMQLGGCSTTATPAAPRSGSTSSLLDLQTGTFRATQDLDDAAFVSLVDRRVAVSAPHIGDHVFYWQVNRGRDHEVYRQRLLVFSVDRQTQDILQTSWSFNDAARFVDAFTEPQRFAGLTSADLSRPVTAQCVQRWRPTPTGWHGSVDPGVCRIWSKRRSTWRRIESQIELLDDGMWLVERGYDDEMNHVFGTPLGQRLWLERVR